MSKKALIMCRTGMGSSLMLKINVQKIVDKLDLPLDLEHDVFSGFAGRNCDLIITMDDLADEFKNSDKHIIAVKDIMDTEYLEQKLTEYFQEN